MFKTTILATSLMGLVIGCSSSANDLGGKNSPNLSDGDNKFLTAVTESNMTEIAASQRAMATSNSVPVKNFAKMMIDDHQKATGEVGEVSTAVGFAPPTMLDSDHQGMVDGLNGKSGSDLDKAYIDDQIKAHKATISAAEDEANNGTNMQVKNLATALLPTLRAHLSAAQNIHAGGNGAMGGGM